MAHSLVRARRSMPTRQPSRRVDHRVFCQILGGGARHEQRDLGSFEQRVDARTRRWSRSSNRTTAATPIQDDDRSDRSADLRDDPPYCHRAPQAPPAQLPVGELVPLDQSTGYGPALVASRQRAERVDRPGPPNAPCDALCNAIGTTPRMQTLSDVRKGDDYRTLVTAWRNAVLAGPCHLVERSALRLSLGRSEYLQGWNPYGSIFATVCRRVPEASATVTASGRLDHPRAHPNLSAMLLAAGHGTRLAPLTDLVPKPLCPVGNTPMIDMALRHASGQTDHTIVNVHGFRDEFERRRPSGIDLSVEKELLGTAGGVANVASWVGDDDLLVINSDALLIGDIGPFVSSSGIVQPSASSSRQTRDARTSTECGASLVRR